MLVGGDFNDWRSLLWPTFTNGFGFQCATDSKTGRRGALATYPSFSPQGGLDRIYYRGPIHLVSTRRCRLQVSRVASDHLPVIAEFEID
jgi:endonuclease/exonuclease/phosphatase family metal-dependent hydrolase